MLPSTVAKQEARISERRARIGRWRVAGTLGVTALVFVAVVTPSIVAVLSKTEEDVESAGDFGSGSGLSGDA